MAAVHQCANVAIYAWDETQEVMEEGREYCSVDSRGTIKCFASNHPRGNSCKISSTVFVAGIFEKRMRRTKYTLELYS